jgi:hypothetical protein
MRPLARGTTQRGAGAPFMGMRPWSRPKGAHFAVPQARIRGRLPEGTLLRPTARPALAGIDSKSIVAKRRHENVYMTIGLKEASA